MPNYVQYIIYMYVYRDATIQYQVPLGSDPGTGPLDFDWPIQGFSSSSIWLAMVHQRIHGR